MQPVGKRHGGLHICRQRAKPRRHVLGQIPTVRSGIRQQLLFVQGLGIVQGLLRRIPIDAVGIPLQGGQVVEFGRLHHAPGCLDAAYGGTLSLAGALYRLRLLAVGKALALRGEAALQLHGIERLRMKGGNLLPVISNQKMNEYLGEIAEVCQIDKRITFHLARHFDLPLCLKMNSLQKFVSR